MKIQVFSLESNYAIHKIARQNNEKHEHLIIPSKHYENHDMFRIPRQSH